MEKAADGAEKDLSKVRAALKKYADGKGGKPAINDQLAFLPDDRELIDPQPQQRLGGLP